MKRSFNRAPIPSFALVIARLFHIAFDFSSTFSMDFTLNFPFRLSNCGTVHWSRNRLKNKVKFCCCCCCFFLKWTIQNGTHSEPSRNSENEIEIRIFLLQRNPKVFSLASLHWTDPPPPKKKSWIFKDNQPNKSATPAADELSLSIEKKKTKKEKGTKKRMLWTVTVFDFLVNRPSEFEQPRQTDRARRGGARNVVHHHVGALLWSGRRRSRVPETGRRGRPPPFCLDSPFCFAFLFGDRFLCLFFLFSPWPSGWVSARSADRIGRRPCIERRTAKKRMAPIRARRVVSLR